MFPKKAGYFGFNSLSKQRSRAVAQNVGQSIGEGPWLNQSKKVSVGHVVSLLRWRSEGVKHPYDTPPYPCMPVLCGHAAPPQKPTSPGFTALLQNRSRLRPRIRSELSWRPIRAG